MVFSYVLPILSITLSFQTLGTSAASTNYKSKRGYCIAAASVNSTTDQPNPTAVIPQPSTVWPGWSSGLKHLFVFGDSYSTTGFNVTGVQPAIGNPLGNPNPASVTSNGPNWVEFLTEVYNASTLLTYDFAFSGATVDEVLAPPYWSGVPSVRQQIQQEFLPGYAAHNATWNGWTGADSLFAFWIGINDIGEIYSKNNVTDYQAAIFNTYGSLLEQLYASGARNYLFINVPPIQRSPQTIDTSKTTNPNALSQDQSAIEMWNQRLIDLMNSFAANHTDVSTFLLDSYALFNSVLDNPAQYPQTAGYKNVTGYCPKYSNGTPNMDTLDPACTYPVNAYFWLNELHPTYPMHNLTAFAITEVLNRGSSEAAAVNMTLSQRDSLVMPLSGAAASRRQLSESRRSRLFQRDRTLG